MLYDGLCVFRLRERLQWVVRQRCAVDWIAAWQRCLLGTGTPSASRTWRRYSWSPACRDKLSFLPMVSTVEEVMCVCDVSVMVCDI